MLLDRLIRKWARPAKPKDLRLFVAFNGKTIANMPIRDVIAIIENRPDVRGEQPIVTISYHAHGIFSEDSLCVSKGDHLMLSAEVEK
jgi:hypothetical protein